MPASPSTVAVPHRPCEWYWRTAYTQEPSRAGREDLYASAIRELEQLRAAWWRETGKPPPRFETTRLELIDRLSGGSVTCPSSAHDALPGEVADLRPAAAAAG